MTDREMLEMLVRQRLLEKKLDHLINVDIKHLQDTMDTIVALLQMNGTIPTMPGSILI